jgi:autotransporter-associated beta strand protein
MTTGPCRRGGRATTSSLALLLLLLACVAGCSVRAVRAQATVFTGTVAGREITNFSFPKFDQNRFQLATNLTFTGNATVNQGALQVTPDSSNNFATFLVN